MKRRLQAGGQIGTYIKVAGAGPAAEPFDGSADRKVGSQARDVERQGPGRLIHVQDHSCTDPVRFFNHRRHILDVSAAEQHDRERDQHGALIDGVEQTIEVRPDRVVGRHILDLGAVPP